MSTHSSAPKPGPLGDLVITDAKRAWSLVAIRGGIAVIFGVLALVWPALTVLALAILFGVYALIDGIGAVVHTVRPGDRAHRWWYLAIGLLGIVAGVITLVWPGITIVALALVIGAWALVTGVAEIAAAIRLRRQITGEWVFIVAGVLSILAGILIFVHPIAGAFGIALLIGAYALAYGIMLLMAAYRLHKYTRNQTSAY